jgi:site-specific DNA-cytosine methylase
MLDLFSGTASVSTAFRAAGWETTTLDRDLPADIQADIMTWDFEVCRPGHFDFVWASPPCTEYSRAKTTGTRDLATANEIVQRTLLIIRHLQPKAWVLENPQTGLLKQQRFMEPYDYVDVDYCTYGCDYRKRTRLWGTLSWQPRPLCAGGCGKVVDGRHLQTAQKAGNRSLGQRNHSSRELYAVPKALVESIIDAVEAH